MTPDPQSRADFGCQRCWPPDADAAWQARAALRSVGELIDESHFHVFILACPLCAQRFLSVFTESIDWSGGDDAQYWTLLPITAAEADDLVRGRESLTEAQIEGLTPGRRCLRCSHPTGAGAALSWGAGIFIGFHD